MISRGVFLLLFLLFVVGIHAQSSSLLTLPSSPQRTFPDRWAPPRGPRSPYSCHRFYCILDNPRCSIPPWIFMPCVTYTLPRSFASCDCRLWIGGAGK